MVLNNITPYLYYFVQVKNQARDIYEQYFRAAEAMPRGVVAKIRIIVQQLEAACAKQITQVKVRTYYLICRIAYI
jgi:E3 ubiquitin-protein ligase HECTD1